MGILFCPHAQIVTFLAVRLRFIGIVDDADVATNRTMVVSIKVFAVHT